VLKLPRLLYCYIEYFHIRDLYKMPYIRIDPSRKPLPPLPPYCPTRPSKTVAPPYRPSASTSLNSHPLETPSSLISRSGPTPYSNFQPPPLQQAPNSASASTTNNPTTLQILIHQPSDPTPPPPIYKRVPSFTPSINEPRDPRSKLVQDYFSQPPPSYTPQANLTPPSTSRNLMDSSSENYGNEEEASECCCFPNFHRLASRDARPGGGRAAGHQGYAVVREGSARWNDAGYLSGGVNQYPTLYGGGDVWRAMGGQYAFCVF
jgi:hypothetical protein